MPEPPPLIDFPIVVDNGEASVALMVEGLHCAACVWVIEQVLLQNPAVVSARINMTTRRLVLRFTAPDQLAAILEPIHRIGYRLVPFDPDQLEKAEGGEEKRLLRALAVAGFGAANVMMLSAAVWAGLDMGPQTRDLLHWISALVAVPVVGYAILPFARGARRALAARAITMDVPITLAVLLATGVSVWETARGGPHAYFEASTMLLFFLLVGRMLEARARGQARQVAGQWVRLEATAVTVLDALGRPVQRPVATVTVGAVVLVAAGERIGVDGVVMDGVSCVDASLVSGESVPVTVTPGTRVLAGTLNLDAALRVRVEAVGDKTVLADILRLMDVALQGRGRFVTLADRVARIYGPAVHALALATFSGWWLRVGIDGADAVMIAAAVLIVTCPCALALAVPAVGIVACGRLMRRGVLVKSATALERLAQVDHVVFDKTGTLTLGRPRLRPGPADALQTGGPADLLAAAALATTSRHPLARALSAAAGPVTPADGVREHPGDGLSCDGPDGPIRLGRRGFCAPDGADAPTTGPELWFARPGRPLVRFLFDDPLRHDATATVRWLQRRGLGVEILSGDRAGSVAAAAEQCGIDVWWAERSPADKAARLSDLATEGHRVLMVGDGLNDAPALAGAWVSISPTTALDLTRTTSDVVFQGEALGAVAETLAVARASQRIMAQNLALSLAYNALFIPLAVLGLITPVLAAVAMSTSSLLVTLNALRVGRSRPVSEESA